MGPILHHSPSKLAPGRVCPLLPYPVRTSSRIIFAHSPEQRKHPWTDGGPPTIQDVRMSRRPPFLFNSATHLPDCPDVRNRYFPSSFESSYKRPEISSHECCYLPPDDGDLAIQLPISLDLDVHLLPVYPSSFGSKEDLYLEPPPPPTSLV